ncbi:MAG: DUF4150 domain-containing protein [Desulfobacteraceae bacterium]|nr:DUF4150 domain-containing protein [Desulfobacteraceae bacterium]
MPATVIVNNLTVVHKTSNGMVTFMPDVCKTPAPPAPPIPIPYPNIAMSQDTAMGSKTVKVDGNPIMLKGSVFSQSTGDEAGSIGGVVSGVIKGKAEFICYSFDVKVEGKNVPRLGDMMLGNKGSAPNTPPMAEIQPPAVAAPSSDSGVESPPDKINIKVTDGKDKPVKDVKYKLKKPDGTTEEGTLSSSGEVKVPKSAPGAGKISLPDLTDTTIKGVD